MAEVYAEVVAGPEADISAIEIVDQNMEAVACMMGVFELEFAAD